MDAPVAQRTGAIPLVAAVARKAPEIEWRLLAGSNMGEKDKIAAEPPVRVRYDCSKCPGYCCSYPRIEVKPSDLKRLARYFNVSVEVAARRFTRIYMDEGKPERILRHQKDTVYETICRFFDTDTRRCTIYEGRPAVCRDYPNGKTCGYYTFLKFERKHQDDKSFVPSA